MNRFVRLSRAFWGEGTACTKSCYIQLDCETGYKDVKDSSVARNGCQYSLAFS